ncbi:hypothetical protein JCM10207_001490 [Rhodosporidiobolus poonsookiae]
MTFQIPYITLHALLVVLNSLPLFWQFRLGNSGPIALGVWVWLANTVDLINASVWYSDTVNRAPIWCDISIKITLGVQIGRLAAVFAIARFLADVVSPRATAMTRQDRIRRAAFDYFTSFGVPLLAMGGHIIYQGNRFAIQRGVGCSVTYLMSWPYLVLQLIWQPVFAVGSVLYSTYTVYRLIRHRRNFARVVAGSHSALTTSRFMRLLALSLSYLLIGVPLALWTTVEAIRRSQRYSDYSWNYFRSAWHLAPITYNEQLPSARLPTFWSDIIIGFIFFAAFGFGTEAVEVYKRAVSPCLGRRSALGPS